MIKIENVVTPSAEVWKAVIRGMRNPLNSWDKSDSHYTELYHNVHSGAFWPYTPDISMDSTRLVDDGQFYIGDADYDLMMRLVKSGSEHRKFMRMLPVYFDVTAPLYWWKEADTYKLGTTRNSCSTMHKIMSKEFTKDDFSWEDIYDGNEIIRVTALRVVGNTLRDQLAIMNGYRKLYLEAKEPHLKKMYWRSLIQFLPSAYNQKATLNLNYETLRNIYFQRKNHKLSEWHEFCDVLEMLPMKDLICSKEGE